MMMGLKATIFPSSLKETEEFDSIVSVAEKLSEQVARAAGQQEV